MAGRRHYPQRNGNVVSAALFMQVRGSQIYNYFFARNMESKRLEGGHRPKEALPYGGIGQAHKMNPYPKGDVYFHGYGHGFDARYLCRMYIDKHYSDIVKDVKYPLKSSGIIRPPTKMR